MGCTQSGPERERLFSAARSGDIVTLRQVLQSGTIKPDEALDEWDLCAVGCYAVDKATALHYAAQAGHADCVAELLQRGASVDANDCVGNTPLIWAAQAGKLAAMHVLIQHGAHVDYHNRNGMTALMRAAQNAHVACVTLLLNSGADPTLARKNPENGVLMTAEAMAGDAVMNTGPDGVQRTNQTKAVLHQAAGNWALGIRPRGPSQEGIQQQQQQQTPGIQWNAIPAQPKMVPVPVTAAVPMQQQSGMPLQPQGVPAGMILVTGPNGATFMIPAPGGTFIQHPQPAQPRQQQQQQQPQQQQRPVMVMMGAPPHHPQQPMMMTTGPLPPQLLPQGGHQPNVVFITPGAPDTQPVINSGPPPPYHAQQSQSQPIQITMQHQPSIPPHASHTGAGAAKPLPVPMAAQGVQHHRASSRVEPTVVVDAAATVKPHVGEMDDHDILKDREFHPDQPPADSHSDRVGEQYVQPAARVSADLSDVKVQLDSEPGAPADAGTSIEHAANLHSADFGAAVAVQAASGTESISDLSEAATVLQDASAGTPPVVATLAAAAASSPPIKADSDASVEPSSAAAAAAAAAAPAVSASVSVSLVPGDRPPEVMSAAVIGPSTVTTDTAASLISSSVSAPAPAGSELYRVDSMGAPPVYQPLRPDAGSTSSSAVSASAPSDMTSASSAAAAVRPTQQARALPIPPGGVHRCVAIALSWFTVSDEIV